MDWADEQASAIYGMVTDNFAKETPAKIRSRIAFDLRQAKADGIREAANYSVNEIGGGEILHVVHVLRARANQIERGEI